MPNRVSLIVEKGKLKGRQFVFVERACCIVGRSDDCDPQVPDDEFHRQISRHHCLLDINPPDIRVRDFGSMNGTFVNGQKIGCRPEGMSPEEGVRMAFPEHDLKDGDRIELGETVFRIACFVPPVCVECDGEIPEAAEADARIAPDVYWCPACRRRAQAEGRQLALLAGRKCIRCGRSVEGEVGRHRRGEYVCAACRADPQAALLRLFARARADGGELRSIEGYAVERELGRGGMGAVYLARRHSTGERVAIKVMLPQVAADQQARQRFLREVQNTQALSHPHVVAMREAGCSDGVFFFALEFCDGGDLAQRMTSCGGILQVEEAVAHILQVLDGLSYAHEAPIPNVLMKDGSYQPGRGLIHRDLKPQNILLSRVGGQLTAKVSDYGLGKAFDAAGLSGQTRSGVAMGTPVFMAREQVRKFKYALPDVDVWAAAATLYYLLTGRYVRNFSADRDLWPQVLQLDAIPIRQRDPRIPLRLAEVIDTALRESPRIGFQTASEFKRALQSVL